MKNRETKFPNLIAVALACAVLAGCSTQPVDHMDPDEPIPEDLGPADNQVGSTLPLDQAPPETAPTHDEGGVPLDPETGQPLARVVYFNFDQSVINIDSPGGFQPML